MLDGEAFKRLDRGELESQLRSLVQGPLSADEFRLWLASAIAGDDFELDEGDIDLVMSAVYRLDSTRSDSELTSLAERVYRILQAVDGSHMAEGLIRLDAERERWEAVLERHLAGTVSRVGLLSFLASRSLPRPFRQAVAQLGPESLGHLLALLKRGDYGGVAEMLR